MRSCKSLGASLGVVTVSTFWTFLVHGPLQTFTMWPGLPQLKQRLLQGSFFTGLVWSRSIGWGAGGVVVVEGLEKEEEEEEAAVGEVMTGGEWNKDSLVVAAFSWVFQNHLHWLLSREVLCFHSAQVVGMGLSR